MAWRPKKVFHGLWAVWSNYTTPIRGKLCLRLCFLNFVFYYLHRKGKKESEVTQLCPTLCNSMDCSLPGSSIHGIFQAGVLEWKFSSPGESSRPRDRTQVSHITGRHFTIWATRKSGRVTINCMLPVIPVCILSNLKNNIKLSQLKKNTLQKQYDLWN